MPMQVAKTGLLARLGAKLNEAAEQTKNKEPDIGNIGQLPAGIRGGIAQLKGIGFKEIEPGSKDYKAGELRIRFFAFGIVKSPHKVKDPATGEIVEIKGLRTQIFEDLWDTPNKTRKTLHTIILPNGTKQTGHIEWVQDIMKSLIGTAPPDGTPEREEWATLFDAAHLEDTAEKLKAAKVHFRFETYSMPKQVIRQLDNGQWWVCAEQKDSTGKVVKYEPVKGRGPYKTEDIAKKNNPYAGREPMVNHKWGAACEFNESEVHPSEAGTEDSSGAPPTDEVSGNGEAETHVEVETETETQVEATTEGAEAEGGATEELPDDLESLVAMANEEMTNPHPNYEVGGPACEKLTQVALSVGLAEEVINDNSWDDLAVLIAEALQSSQGATDTVEEPSPEPEPEPEPPPPPQKPKVTPKAPAATQKLPTAPVAKVTKPTIGGIYSYQVIDSKTGKPALGKDKKPAKPVRVEVTYLDEKAKTCTLKNVDDKKTTYLKVPWANIKPA